MLTAYYNCSCDSHMLFDDKEIAKSAAYARHLNQYNVICLDITSFSSEARSSLVSLQNVPDMIKKALWKDLGESGFEPRDGDTMNDFLLRCVEKGDGKPFIFIIDEWDAVIREAKDDPVAQTAYLNLLCGWFKNENLTLRAVAAAYITGILPIKKDTVCYFGL